MSYEESDAYHGANLTAAMDSYATLRGHIVIHTSTLPVLFLLLIVATSYQGLSVFEGDFWRPEYHYDFFSSEFHQFALNASDVLNVEHPFHEEVQNLPDHHRHDHPHHHSNLEKIVESHAQMVFLRIAFHAYLLIPISAALRFYFFLSKQSYITTLIIMFLILISAIAQFIALMGNIMILFSAVSLWVYVKLFITLLVFLIEISTLQDLHEIRKYVMYFSQLYHMHKVEQAVKEPETLSPEEIEETKQLIVKPFSMYDAIQSSIANLDSLVHQKKKKKRKGKFD